MKKKLTFSRRRFLGTTASAMTGLIIYPLNAIQGAGDGKQELEKPVTVSSSKIQFSMSPVNGAWQIKDNISKTIWNSNPFLRCFGEVVLNVEGKPTPVILSQCQISRKGKSLTATFHPLEKDSSLAIRLIIQPGKALNSLNFSYEADPGLTVENISLLNKSLWTTDAEQGYVVIPVREGLLIPADSGLSYKHRFDTYAYEGCHMTMAGIVKGKATALITWDDPYTAIEIDNQPHEIDTSHQILTTSAILSKTSKSVQIQFCGNGDYITIAQVYSKTPQSGKWQIPWTEKIKNNPDNIKLLGASNIKLWSALTRRMNPESTQEISKRINWTFEEAAQVAEHFKNDVKIDACVFTVGGWIHRGYDNQHPDILPPAPECGGERALADCSNRVMKLGYLFCLHDNYQDIYKDSPSWDENYIMKKPDGSLAKGGAWNGGTAYLTCSKKALELAKRPQNLPAVKKSPMPILTSLTPHMLPDYRNAMIVIIH